MFSDIYSTYTLIHQPIILEGNYIQQERCLAVFWNASQTRQNMTNKIAAYEDSAVRKNRILILNTRVRTIQKL